MIALLLLSTIPLELPLHDHVDELELNIVYDDCGHETLRQAIAWRWNRATCRHEVQAWWLVKDDQFGRDVLRFDGATMRRVTADRCYIWHSQSDREIEDRHRLPVEEQKRVGEVF